MLSSHVAHFPKLEGYFACILSLFNGSQQIMFLPSSAFPPLNEALHARSESKDAGFPAKSQSPFRFSTPAG